MELILHKEAYESTSSTRLQALFSNPVSASSYDKLLTDACKRNQFSELAHMYALSAALGTVIQSYMPASSTVRLANPYTCLVIGRGVRSFTAAKFTLMWTMMSEPQHAVNFRPDHFALLIRRSDDTVHTVEIQHNDDEGNCANDSSVIMEHCQDEQQQQEQHSDHNDSSIENSRISSVTGEISATATCSTVPTGVSELQRPDGLTTAEVVSMLRNPTAILPRIPYGEKNDVHFAMSNQRNVERRRHGQPNTFDDDCGVWEKKTARYNKYPYLQQDGGILKRVFWNVSMQKYCR